MFKISFSSSLLVCGNTIDFCILTVYPVRMFNLLIGSMNLTISDTLHNWNHAVFVFLCLVYFT